MSEPVTSSANPYAVPLADLEREVRVPADEQVTGGAHDGDGAAAWAWDEGRRQTQLAGGA